MLFILFNVMFVVTILQQSACIIFGEYWLCISDKQKYDIQLDAADGHATVKQLAEQVADVTKIPITNQRLICKGE